MRVLTERELPIKQPTAVAVGLFDGVHKGHQALLEDIVSRRGLKSAVYTFDTKPAAPDRLFTEEEKQSIFSAAGIDYYYTKRFDRTFAALSPEAFLRLLVEGLCARHITVGYDFRFGKDAKGDVDFLREYADRFRYTLSVVPEISLDNGEKIASTAIREAVKNGAMQKAALGMGRFYFIDGKIESGNRIGNQIGFPTANIRAEKLLPAHGVYATIVKTDDGLYRSVTNVGTKPTIKTDDTVNVETFILDFNRDIYGKNIRVFFVERQRGEIAFDSLGALRSQIAEDSRNAGEILKDLEVYKPFIMC